MIFGTDHEQGEGSVTNTAAKMLDLISDLGECRDSRQIIVAATRRFRQLFGDYVVYGLLLADPSFQHWSVLSVESPYAGHWGGVKHEDLPAETDTDEIARRHGRDVTARLMADHVLKERLLDQEEAFSAGDNVLATRLAALLGAPARSIMAASWRRPTGHGHGWAILGYAEAKEITPGQIRLFETAVDVTSRMGFYPALVNFITRTERENMAVRRNIVHDLKTPLTVIRGYAETLQIPEVGEDPEMRAELLQGIVESSQRLLEDLKDILEPVDRAWEPKKEVFDLAMLVNRTVMAERQTDRAKHHTIEVHGVDEPTMVCADLRKVRRVLENLVSNAIKYSPGTGKKVHVRLDRSDREVRIAISDQGLGMSAEQLAQVMADGGRVVDASLGIEGSGFGLDSVKRVLGAHGGRLQAESRQGAGTTFYAFLPIA